MAVRDPLVPPAPRHHLSSAATFSAETTLGHHFARPELLREALTHRSALHERGGGGSASNERLEFVGDRVLGLLVAEWLAEKFPAEPEGKLGPRLAELVSQPVLAEVAERIGLPAALTVAPGESRAGVRQRATVLADALEATLGAVYLDGGLEPARRFVRTAWASAVDGQRTPPKDAKTGLQEWLLARGRPLPDYDVVGTEGPPHAPAFTIRVAAGERQAQATAGSKREAERRAAELLLAELSA